MNLMTLFLGQAISLGDGFISTLAYAVFGIIIAVVSYFIVDLIIPGKMGKQIAEDQNMAIAIVAGATILGICIIIAASIVG